MTETENREKVRSPRKRSRLAKPDVAAPHAPTDAGWTSADAVSRMRRWCVPVGLMTQRVATMPQTKWRRWLNGLSRTFFGAPGRLKPRRAPYRGLRLEPLEDRLVPSFDLTVGSTAATSGVTSSVSGTTTTFTATATGAFLNTADIVTALNTGDVVVDSGSTGAENGDITIDAGVTNPLASGNALTFQSGSNAGVGDVTVNAAFAPQGTTGTFPLSFLALNNLTLNADVNAGAGTVVLGATNGAVTQTAGVLTAADLAVVSSGSAALGDANDVGTLAGQTSGAFSFVNGPNALTVNAVGGVSGLHSSTDNVLVTTGATLTLDQGVSAILIGLNAGGAVTQAGGAALNATAGLVLQGAGPFTLTNAGNTSPNIAASVTGDVDYVNAGALQTSSFNLNGFGDTVGVSSTGGAVTLATASGDLTVEHEQRRHGGRGGDAHRRRIGESVDRRWERRRNLRDADGRPHGPEQPRHDQRRHGGDEHRHAAVGCRGPAHRPGRYGRPERRLATFQRRVEHHHGRRLAHRRRGQWGPLRHGPHQPGQRRRAVPGDRRRGPGPQHRRAGRRRRRPGRAGRQRDQSGHAGVRTGFSQHHGCGQHQQHGALDVADVDGLTASANAGGATSLSTVGALTFSVAVTSSGDLTITTTNTAGATDGAVTVAAGGGVQSTGGAVTLTAAAGLNILGPVSAATALQLTGTGALDVSAALTGTPVVVTGNGAGDVFTISPAGSSPLVLVGLGAGDTFNELSPETTPISIYSGAGGVFNYEASGAPLGVATDRVSANVSDPTTYSGVQTLYFNDAAAVAEGPGPDTADRDTAFAGLTAQEHSVQALYLDDLGRAGSKAELDVWVAMLNAPGGSQTAVASALGRSAEAETHLVRGWYAAYLGRSAVGGEEQGWVNQLLSGQTEEQVLSGFLATSEFYAHAQTLSSSGSADTRFVQALYQLLIDRGGEASGVASWVNATSLLGRQEAARRFLGALEFRTDDFEADYDVLLHRPSDLTTLQAWVNSGPDVGAIRAQVAGGAEFFSNG